VHDGALVRTRAVSSMLINTRLYVGVEGRHSVLVYIQYRCI
jgi:hypothetical protein